MKKILFVVFLLFIGLNAQVAKPAQPAKKDCVLGKTYKPNACVCKAKSLCTKKLCICFKTLTLCSNTKSFSRRTICRCPSGTVRKCKKLTCTCGKPKTKPGKGSKGKGKKRAPLLKCKPNTPYKKSSCLCNTFERCSKKFQALVKNVKVNPKDQYCMCLQSLKTCPKTFVSTDICKCGKGFRRDCKNKQCTCVKVPACNPHSVYTSRKDCFCQKKFTFMFCTKKKAPGIGELCKCTHLNEACPPNKPVGPRDCYCNTKTHLWKCNKIAGKRSCVCQPKPLCRSGERVRRDSCRCQIRPTTRLEDENSQKKRVLRAYGWKDCKRIDPKNKLSPRTCVCRPLKCYEAGRFKKYFCKCPRKTKQYCNKKTDYCKCISKIREAWKGDYKFMGLITTKSKKLASLKFLKFELKVYTEANKQKLEKRYGFVSTKNGSFYVVKKPTLKKDKMEAELALYQVNDQNWSSIQDQIKKVIKEFAKKYPYPKKK